MTVPVVPEFPALIPARAAVLPGVMGICSSDEAPPPYEDARRELDSAMAASPPLQLKVFVDGLFVTVDVRELYTVRMAMGEVALELGLPYGAAAWLQMRRSDTVLSPEITLKNAGLHQLTSTKLDGGLSIIGEAEARRNVVRASSINLFDAARTNQVEDVALVCTAFPEKVNESDAV